MMFKFILNRNIGDKVHFTTKYFVGEGIISIQGNGDPQILTDKFSFPYQDVKTMEVIK